jgi:hypothetical protein
MKAPPQRMCRDLYEQIQVDCDVRAGLRREYVANDSPLPQLAVPHFVPTLDQRSSQLVAEQRGRERPILTRKINVLVGQRTPS